MFTCVLFFFFFKQKTAYEMRISDWSSDVCSSDLLVGAEESQLGELLGDGAAALDDPSRHGVARGSTEDAPGIDAAVVVEAPVLDGEEGILHMIDRKSKRLNSSH